MKTKYPSMFGALAILLLVASFVVPGSMANPAPAEALDPICQWDVVQTPSGLAALTNDVVSPSEVTTLVVGSDGATMWITDPGNTPSVRRTTNGGITWSGATTIYAYLLAAGATPPVWYVAIAPDDVNFVAVVTTANTGPQAVYVTDDGGANWQNTTFTPTANTEFISCIDISMVYTGTSRDILVGTRDGAGGGDIYVLRAPGFAGWQAQLLTDTGAPAAWTADIYAAKFSPTYVGDAAIVAIASGDRNYPATFHTDTVAYIGIRDLASTPGALSDWSTWGPVEVGDPTTAAGTSPTVGQMITADLELPSDFSGQTTSLRRVYVSTDAQSPDPTTGATPDTGIFRLDDTTVYRLMNTDGLYGVPAAMNTNLKRISSIAYYGTYASGKLLAGEVLGWSCTAQVPTWFTDSPTTCPIPCWYPALKATTGAACQIGDCASNWQGWGNAQVAWRVDGALAFVGTSAASTDNFTAPSGAAAVAWPDGLLNTLPLDESAFGLSRNNGETWNQLSLIDTAIDKFTDVAPAADCSTVYLASVNDNTTACCGFDSVWRSGTAAAVVSPLPPLPLGTYWERVLCRVTATTCNQTANPQTNHAILRLAPDKTDGQIVFWAAGGTNSDATNTNAVVWSPDYGDYWARINPRINVQDLDATSSTLLYILNTGGRVQKMPYTGTAWSSATSTVATGITGHTIRAFGDDWVLVGDSGAYAAAVPAAYSSNAGASYGFIIGATPFTGHVHVLFDPAFADNSIVYAGFDDTCTGSIYRWSIGTSTDWVDTMGNGAYGTAHTAGYYGLAAAHTGGALYGAHDNCTTIDAAVERTLTPTSGMPKPGMFWDCLNVFQGTGSHDFTLEPRSLKKCGCLTLDTDTSLFAIDNDDYSYRVAGDLWMFTDCVAKAGLTLTMEDELLVGCDPVSGRNQEINFTWEQLCIALGYDIEIAKDENFTMKVFDWMTGAATATIGAGTANPVYVPDAVTSPAMLFPAAGGSGVSAWGVAQPRLLSQLECGHTYYWRACVRACATNQIITSPWSEVRSFTIKAGLPVVTPYYGVQLLSPDNGCIGCPVSPASFSWSPFKDITKYKFVLAKDAALTDVVAEAEVATTAFEYEGTLDYSTNYFWRVMGISPAPSDWSATFSFQTEAAPPAPPAAPPAPVTPMWVWVVIAIGAILVIVTLVLIFKTRRV